MLVAAPDLEAGARRCSGRDIDGLGETEFSATVGIGSDDREIDGIDAREIEGIDIEGIDIEGRDSEATSTRRCPDRYSSPMIGYRTSMTSLMLAYRSLGDFFRQRATTCSRLAGNTMSGAASHRRGAGRRRWASRIVWVSAAENG